jgi:anaerobic magnesium-protoporphyrin IX monomethyl ester cyclase
MKTFEITLIAPFSGEREYELCDPSPGLVYLATYLRNQEPPLPCGILDTRAHQLSPEQTVQTLLAHPPRLLGISATTNQYPNALAIARGLKQAGSGIVVVLGGAHGSALPEECAALPEFDYVVQGEGETALLNLCQHVFRDEPLAAPGIYHRQDGRVVCTGPAVRQLDLDRLPFPDWALLDIDRYFQRQKSFAHAKRHPYLPIVTSRGCPGQCTFCSRAVYGNRTTFRSPQSLVAEIKENIRRFGIREIRIMDDCFNINIGRVIEFCKRVVQEGLNLTFALPNGMRSDRVTDELLHWMKKAGFYMIFFGIESGDQTVLDRIKKGTRVEDIAVTVRKCKQAGFYTCGFFVVGLPGSTPENERSILDFARKNRLDFIGVAMCTPYPGSEIFRDQPFRGDWSLYKHDFSKAGDGPLYIPDGRTIEDMLASYRRIYAGFYSSPAFILGRLRHISWLGRRIPFFLNALYRRFIKKF